MSQNSEKTMDCFNLIYTAEIVTESGEYELAECIDISLRQNDIGCASALVVEISQVQGTLAARLSLAREFHQAALQPSTVCQYEQSLHRWYEFCSANNLCSAPASVASVASFASLIASETQSVSAVEKLLSAISFEHRHLFLPSPTLHESMNLLVRGIKKRFSSERRRKKPLTHEILCRMIDQLYSPEHGHEGLWAPMSMWRTIWHAIMEFSTLGRFDDIVHLRRHAVTILLEPKPHLLVHFMGGKTDIFSEGSERLVCSHTPSDHYCPVHLTEMYFLRLGVTYLGYLVPRTKLISGVLVADPNQPLSYTTALEDLMDILTCLGLDASEYGEHSGK